MIKRLAITVAAACMIVVLSGLDINEPLPGILDLEFATTKLRAVEIYNAWSKANVLQIAKTNTYWDFLFLVCYGSFFYVMCQWLGSSGTFKISYANLFAKLGLLAAVLDVAENIFMLEIMNGSFIEWHVLVMTIISVVKWILAALCVCFILLGCINYVYNKSKKIKNK